MITVNRLLAIINLVLAALKFDKNSSFFILQFQKNEHTKNLLEQIHRKFLKVKNNLPQLKIYWFFLDPALPEIFYFKDDIGCWASSVLIFIGNFNINDIGNAILVI